GLYQARRKQRDLDRIYIVEGYMDVLALSQFGIGNVVATLGTAATTDHLDKLFRHAPQLVFCFDGDEAGRKAAWRALELSLPLLKEGRQTLFRFMPQGEDPDSYVRDHGRENFEDRKQMVPLTDYLLSRLREGLDLKTREGRATLLEKAVPYLRQLPPSALRELLIQDLATQGQIQVETMKSMCRNKISDRPTARGPLPRKQTPSLSPVRKCIRQLLNYPDLVREISDPESLIAVDEHGMTFLRELVDFIQHREKTTAAHIIEHWRDTKYEEPLRQLLQEEELISDPEMVRLNFRDITTTLIDKHTRKIRSQVALAINDMETLKSIYSRQQADTESKSDLA
ncbi:MAG: toprim domain-containing protein, partial [Gammaproteobacteria bacterium]|nr:toprim domain-containing protein [Gammaproteobacteria bacterium]